MNPVIQPSEDPHLDELLDAALAPPPMRTSLVDQIVDATAAQVTSRSRQWLDLALMPPEPSPLLIERVLRASRPVLYRRRHPIRAFFGTSLPYRIAAGVLLTAMLGIWVTLGLIASDASELVAIEASLADLDRLAAAEGSLDAQIGLLDDQLRSLATATSWDADRLLPEDAAEPWPVDAAVSEMPWLF